MWVMPFIDDANVSGAKDASVHTNESRNPCSWSSNVISDGKLFVGISKACEKRPLPVGEIENAVEEIEQEVYRLGKQEVQSSVIGELVMERLRQMDKIAYIRFASVYRSFNDVETMLEELQDLLNRKKAEPTGSVQGIAHQTDNEAD